MFLKTFDFVLRVFTNIHLISLSLSVKLLISVETASYFNEVLLQIEHHRVPLTQYNPQNLKMKTYKNLSPTSDMVGVMVPSIFMLRQKALTPYKFNYSFPCTPNSPHMYTVSP